MKKFFSYFAGTFIGVKQNQIKKYRAVHEKILVQVRLFLVLSRIKYKFGKRFGILTDGSICVASFVCPLGGRRALKFSSKFVPEFNGVPPLAHQAQRLSAASHCSPLITQIAFGLGGIHNDPLMTPQVCPDLQS